MVPQKHKNDSPRLNNLQFLILWLLGHIVSWALALGANRFLFSSGIYIHNLLIMALLMALGPGIPISIIQVMLVERGLKKSMRGWLPVSLIGWVLSGIAFYALWDDIALNMFSSVVQRLYFIPLFLPVAVLQYFWLRRQSRHAALWVLSTVTGAVLFSMTGDRLSYSFGVTRYVLAAIAAILYGAATGATMLYLSMNRTGKVKHSEDYRESVEGEERARLARLSESTPDSELSPLDGAQAVQRAKTTS